LHGVRAILLFGAIACWVMGLSLVNLVVASTMALTTNLFVLPMAYVFLGEQVGWQRTLATLLGFLGVFIVLYESSLTEDMIFSFFHSGNGALYLLAATMMFALSDIVNKRFVSSESTLSMMFYIALGTTLIGVIPAYLAWVMPDMHQLGLLFLLGIGGNLILFFLLKAFAATDVSALSPYRYTELFSAGILGYLIFGETPSLWILLAAAVIIPSTFWIAHYETHKRKQA
jgi:S-adenosylmethionine uptake transporter